MTNTATELEAKKQQAKTELDNARQRVVQLLQEPPSTNLFIRVGIRIRNFFRNLPYFSFDLFKSPLELALERLTKAEHALANIREQEKNTKSTVSNALSSVKNTVKQTIKPPENTNDTLANALIGYIKKGLPAAVSDKLCPYIDIMKIQKQETNETEVNDTAQSSWQNVRDAIHQSSTVNELELENILFKVKLLYPKTKYYDDVVDSKSTISFIDSSLAMLKNLGGQSTAEQSDTPISDQDSSPIFAPNQKNEIRVKINKLENNYKNYLHIQALITLLNNLLDNSRSSKDLDKEIDNKLSKVQIKPSMSTTVPEENQIKELKKLKETINQIKQDIYSLKPEPASTTASISTPKR